jgi:hypothetical protein
MSMTDKEYHQRSASEAIIWAVPRPSDTEGSGALAPDGGRLGTKQLQSFGPRGAQKRKILIQAPGRSRKLKGHKTRRGKMARLRPDLWVQVTAENPPVEELVLRPHGRGDVIRSKMLRSNDPAAKNEVRQPDKRGRRLRIRGDTAHVHDGLVASQERPQSFRKQFRRRETGSCRAAYLQAQSRDQPAISMQTDQVRALGMIGRLKVSSERIRSNELGAQVRLIAELENRIPLGVAPGPPADDALGEMR